MAVSMLLAQLSAASPTPDLSSYLAPAPASDWIEFGADPNVLEGTFTAESYATWLETVNATPSTIAAELRGYGFVSGFGREWEQRATHDLLIERVFQFDAESGATFWYQKLRVQNQTSKDFSGDIGGLDAIPNAFGVVFKAPDGYREFRIEFQKGDFVFVVHTDSATSDLSGLAVNQAMTEYGAATITQSPRGIARVQGVPGLPSWVVPAAAAAFLIAIVLLAVAVLLVLIAASRPGRVTEPATAGAVHMSPDHAYWWDGTRWRDANVEVPPTAQRSPDGAYWWDGQAWRRSG